MPGRIGRFWQDRQHEWNRAGEECQEVNVGSVLGALKGNLDVALSSQVVDLIRANLSKDGGQIRGVGQISVVKHHLDPGLVAITV